MAPPGFRFHPTDGELLVYYLRRKVGGRTIESNIIVETDLYKHEPWDLPEKSVSYGSDMACYFFSLPDKKYPNGSRTNRATEAGYWKSTGKDKDVKKAGGIIGIKKTLVFYQGRTPHGERTNWVMHEYRLNEEEYEKVDAAQKFVLCRVVNKSGVGPRSGDDRRPQTYVDDNIDRELCGSFPEAVKEALEPETASTSAIAPAPEETPVAPTVISAPILHLGDRASCGQAGDAINMSRSAQEPTAEVAPTGSGPISAPSLSVEDYPLSFSENDEFLDCLPSITGELEISTFTDDPLAELSPELFGALQGDRDTPSGMMWGSDLNCNVQPQQQPQQDEANFEVPSSGMLPLELLETDDVLPPSEEELESRLGLLESVLGFKVTLNPPGFSPNYCENEIQLLRGRGSIRGTAEVRAVTLRRTGFSSDYCENENQMLRGRGPTRASERVAAATLKPCGFSSNYCENENQMLRGRGPARASERVAQQQQRTSEEAQHRAFSSNDGLNRCEAAPRPRMSKQRPLMKVVSASRQTLPVEKAGNKEGSESQKPLCENFDTAAASDVLQRRVARGSSSGFVFVFGLGAVSALGWFRGWFRLLGGMWRRASHVFSSVF